MNLFRAYIFDKIIIKNPYNRNLLSHLILSKDRILSYSFDWSINIYTTNYSNHYYDKK